MAVFTWQQCGYWKNSIELSKHALQVTNDNFVAHDSFASALVKKGRIEEAIEHYNKSICLAPEYDNAYKNRGIAYTKLGRYQLAIEDYNKAIHLKPDNADVYYNRGNVYTKLGQYQMALKTLIKPSALNPILPMPTTTGELFTLNLASINWHRGLQQSYPSETG